MRKLLCGVALMCWLMGCGSEPEPAPEPETLGLAELTLDTLELTVDQERRRVSLSLRVGRPGCKPISSTIQAELDGRPMRMMDAGGPRTNHCAEPVFTFDVPEGTGFPTFDGPLTLVRLRDGGTQVAAQVEHLCAQRRLRLVTPSDGVVRPKGLVEVSIEPGTDTLPDPGVVWSTGTQGGGPILSGFNGLEITPRLIRFRAPDITGEGTDTARILLMGMNNSPALVPRVPLCEGFRRCNFYCGAPLYSVELSTPLRVER